MRISSISIVLLTFLVTGCAKPVPDEAPTEEPAEEVKEEAKVSPNPCDALPEESCITEAKKLFGANDRDAALKVAADGCAWGEVEACRLKGELFALREARGAQRETMRAFEAGCLGADAASCEAFVEGLASGRAAEPSNEAALREASRLCGGGTLVMCREAQLYAEAVGVEFKLDDASAERFDGMCDGSEAARCMLVAEIYGEGLGVVVDMARAAAVARRACDAGSDDACAAWTGYASKASAEMAPKVYAEHGRLCKKAREASCLESARMTRDGVGMAADPTRALSMLAESCSVGMSKACDEAKAMVAEELVEEEARAALEERFQSTCTSDAQGCAVVEALKAPSLEEAPEP